MLRTFLLAGLITLSAIPFSAANAEFMKGNKLYETCTTSQVGACLGYIMGTTDTLSLNKIANKKESCIPNGVTGRQLTDIVIEYLTKNPNIRHLPASLLVEWAVSDAFPCKN